MQANGHARTHTPAYMQTIYTCTHAHARTHTHTCTHTHKRAHAHKQACVHGHAPEHTVVMHSSSGSKACCRHNASTRGAGFARSRGKIFNFTVSPTPSTTSCTCSGTARGMQAAAALTSGDSPAKKGHTKNGRGSVPSGPHKNACASSGSFANANPCQSRWASPTTRVGMLSNQRACLNKSSSSQPSQSSLTNPIRFTAKFKIHAPKSRHCTATRVPSQDVPAGSKSDSLDPREAFSQPSA